MGASRFGFYPAGIVHRKDASISPITQNESGRAEDGARGSIGGEAMRVEGESASREEAQEVDADPEDLGERKPNIARRPDKPTKAMIDEHEPLHVHYRSWCPHCQAGRSTSKQHKGKPSDEEPLGPTISIDYAFKYDD